MTSETRSCLACTGTMAAVNVIDKGHMNASRPIEYAAIDAKPSWWTGGIAVAGVVQSYMCRECGLIQHYGVPKS
jgi:hypothetical protein